MQAGEPSADLMTSSSPSLHTTACARTRSCCLSGGSYAAACASASPAKAGAAAASATISAAAATAAGAAGGRAAPCAVNARAPKCGYLTLHWGPCSRAWSASRLWAAPAAVWLCAAAPCVGGTQPRRRASEAASARRGPAGPRFAAGPACGGRSAVQKRGGSPRREQRPRRQARRGLSARVVAAGEPAGRQRRSSRIAATARRPGRGAAGTGGVVGPDIEVGAASLQFWHPCEPNGRWRSAALMSFRYAGPSGVGTCASSYLAATACRAVCLGRWRGISPPQAAFAALGRRSLSPARRPHPCSTLAAAPATGSLGGTTPLLRTVGWPPTAPLPPRARGEATLVGHVRGRLARHAGMPGATAGEPLGRIFPLRCPAASGLDDGGRRARYGAGRSRQAPCCIPSNLRLALHRGGGLRNGCAQNLVAVYSRLG